MEYRVKETLISWERIAIRVGELAADIQRDYEGKGLLLVGVLKGAWIFLADLARLVDLPGVEVDFIRISSYGSGTRPSGELRFDLDFSLPLEGKNVLIVEDIVDTGNTLSTLMDVLRARGPASVKICALLSKPSRREVEVPVDYVGFTIPDEFVVGYGLDCAEQYRTLPGIVTVEECGEGKAEG
jgi:hypoxanthine phosphoribosyltransferase